MKPFGVPQDSLTWQHMQKYKPRAEFHEKLSIVKPTSYGGFCLVAAETIPAGTAVERFEGPLVEYEDCNDYDRRYVLLHLAEDKQWKFLLPLSNARYANHSCDPNCKTTYTQRK